MSKNNKTFFKALTGVLIFSCILLIGLSYKLYTLYSVFFLQLGAVLLIILIGFAFKSYSKYKLLSDMD
ncbi:MAG: hypothetical protein ACRC30_11400, partial [Clostridium sp.]